MAATKNQVFTQSPKQKECFDLLLSGQKNFILYGGAIRGGKTYGMVFLFLSLALVYPNSRWTIIRRTMATLKSTVISMFLSLDFIQSLINSKKAVYNSQDKVFKLFNGSQLIFFATHSTPPSNQRLSIETNGIGFDEMDITEFEFNWLMGRAGSWQKAKKGKCLVTGQESYVPDFILGTSNPQHGWVKSRIFDKWKNGTLNPTWGYIQAKVDDNPGIRDLEAYKEFLKNTYSKAEYEIMVNGDWDYASKVENAFFYNFDQDKHCGIAAHDPEKPIIVCIDENKLPYIAVSFFQIDKHNKTIKQLKSLPCRDPYNTAKKAGILSLNYLNELKKEAKENQIQMNDAVLVFGDVSTKSGNAIDENSRSFAEIFMQELKKSDFEVLDRFLKSNPLVAKSCSFVNALLEGWKHWEIIIDKENCPAAIVDYVTVQSDKEGGMVKKKAKTKDGIVYEDCGHFSDVLRYAICGYLSHEMAEWSNRRFYITTPEEHKMFIKKRY